MKQFVLDFEDFLNNNSGIKERELYSDIKKTLEEKTESGEEKKEKEEKKEAVKEEGIMKAKQTAKQAKHVSGGKVKQPKIQRKALEK